jgi:hypothetical protein
VVTSPSDLMQVLGDADPAEQAEVCIQLGLTLTYRPHNRLVEATRQTRTRYVQIILIHV